MDPVVMEVFIKYSSSVINRVFKPSTHTELLQKPNERPLSTEMFGGNNNNNGDDGGSDTHTQRPGDKAGTIFTADRSFHLWRAVTQPFSLRAETHTEPKLCNYGEQAVTPDYIKVL